VKRSVIFLIVVLLSLTLSLPAFAEDESGSSKPEKTRPSFKPIWDKDPYYPVAPESEPVKPKKTTPAVKSVPKAEAPKASAPPSIEELAKPGPTTVKKVKIVPAEAAEAESKVTLAPPPKPAMPSDVKPIADDTAKIGKEGYDIPPRGIEFLPKGGIVTEKPVKEPLLKKIDVERIGASPYYETYEGLRLLKYFTVGQRVEIFQEAKPIDTYILDAKKMRYVNLNQPWDIKSDYRTQIAPIFTRAYGTEFTMSDPKNKEGQLRYTLDYRDIYNNQFPLYLTAAEPRRNVNYKYEQWLQNEVMLLYAKQIPGIDWNFTMNVGYRYSTMNAKNNAATFAYGENRHTYITNASLAPNQQLEVFGQFEYFKSKRPDSNFIYSPDHFFYAGELRMRSKDLKTSYIPRVSYSIDEYYPFYDRYKKWEMQFRIGHDFNEKLGGTVTFRYVLGIRNEVDNTAPLYTRPNPINQTAAWVGVENRIQYNIYDRLWIQAGLDYSVGTNMSDFDNWAIRGGLEYYAPGIIRVDVGWQGNYYYNIYDFLSSVYFKFYLFM
jgi:hypothetical protein